MKQLLHKYQEMLFNLVIYVTYILVIVSTVGLSENAPRYLSIIDYYIRIYICLFLIWRFNPLRRSYEFTDLDRKIAFSAGVFILTTTALNQYVNEIKKYVSSIFDSENKSIEDK
jgi:purine-cytosine permease-like protein